MTTKDLKRDDVVLFGRVFALVLAIGPTSYDLIEECGGTTRYRHSDGRLDVRLATARDFMNNETYEQDVRDRLAKQAAAARAERKAGARIYRGHVGPR